MFYYTDIVDNIRVTGRNESYQYNGNICR